MKTWEASQNYQVHTFGCKVNTYDSGLLQKRMNSAGFVNEERSGGVHLLNTCAVTAEATKEAIKLARRLKSKDPLATIVVTGCAAQVDTQEFIDLPAVDLVVANSHKAFLQDILRKHFSPEKTERVFKSNIFRKLDFEEGGGSEQAHTRSFLKIQDGCNSFCTYCVIPFGRGRSRSLSVDALVGRVNELHWQGSQEVVLTGVHIGDYEDEQGRQLEDLVEAVLKRTKIPRVRLTSLEPPELSDRLLELFQEEKMCPHFHMSVQSANTKVLRDMRRQYSADDVITSLNKIEQKIKNAFVGMDVIVGFPNESSDDFQTTVKNLDETPWTRIHVFPYSERPGTKAALMSDNVQQSEKKRRSKVLRTMSAGRYNQQAEKQIGLLKSALLLKSRDGQRERALTDDYWPVLLPKDFSIDSKNVFNIKISEVKDSQEGLGQAMLFAVPVF